MSSIMNSARKRDILDKLADKYLKRLGPKPRKPLSSPPRRPPSEALRKRVTKHRRRQNAALFTAFGIGIAVCVLLWWPITIQNNRRTNAFSIVAGTLSVTRPLPSYFGGDSDIYILVVGLDYEPPHRSDSVMVMHLGLENLQARVVSVPRDLRVKLPTGDSDKLAHAYPFGEQRDGQGIEWVRHSVENLLGREMPYYVEVHFDGFVQLVDALGGVDIDVEKAMKYRDRAQDLVIDIKPGYQHMDGLTLLKYVRFRHDALGDIGRMERQQKALRAVLEALKQGDTYCRIPSVVTSMRDTFVTNLSWDQLAALSRQVPKVSGENIRSITIASEPTMRNGVSYQAASAEMVADAIAFLEDLTPAVETTEPLDESNEVAGDNSGQPDLEAAES